MVGLRGKNALITGASRGIGRAIALRLGEEGAHVAVNYATNVEAADAVVRALRARGNHAVALQADMSRPDDVADLFDRAEAALGQLDIVVNNAGAVTFGPIAEASLAEFEQVLALNALGNFRSLQEAARRIRAGGRIINISTGGTVVPSAGAGLYAASKAALEQLSAALAKELGARQITVNVVLPGLTQTDGLVMDPETVAQMVAMTPLGRVGEPDDVAAVVAFLASDDARWLTGQSLRAAGGLI
jgi:3-oxoacyl-[acyl-carrier protein] reductase